MKKEPTRDKHHLFVPRKRGGSSLDTNLLLIKKNRHQCWHRMWDIHIGGRTIPRKLKEILVLLRDTNHENFNPSPHWKTLWGNKNIDEVIALLERVKRIKLSQRFYYRNS